MSTESGPNPPTPQPNPSPAERTLAEQARRGVAQASRALDLSAEISRRSAQRRTKRWRDRAFVILQCAGAAGLAYALAKHVFDLPAPLFAPVAAVVCLGITYGQRLRRAIEITVGVAIGVLVGETIIHLFGIGVWQVALIVLVAMSLATLVGAGVLIATQAGVQAMVIALLASTPAGAFGRWFEAIIGCSVAVLLAAIVPTSALLRPRAQARSILHTQVELLQGVVQALRDQDRPAAEHLLSQARRTERELDRLRGYTNDGLELLRLSPFHRKRHQDVHGVSEVVEPLDRCVRNARVLIRRATVALQTGEAVPDLYVQWLQDLTECLDAIACAMDKQSYSQHTIDRLVSLGERTVHPAAGASLSAEVMRAQMRSMVVDLLMVTGLNFAQAQDLVQPAQPVAGTVIPAQP